MEWAIFSGQSPKAAKTEWLAIFGEPWRSSSLIDIAKDPSTSPRDDTDQNVNTHQTLHPLWSSGERSESGGFIASGRLRRRLR